MPRTIIRHIVGICAVAVILWYYSPVDAPWYNSAIAAALWITVTAVISLACQKESYVTVVPSAVILFAAVSVLTDNFGTSNYASYPIVHAWLLHCLSAVAFVAVPLGCYEITRRYLHTDRMHSAAKKYASDLKTSFLKLTGHQRAQL